MNGPTPRGMDVARVGLGLTCWLLALGLYVAAVRTTAGRRIDDAMFRRLRETLTGVSWVPEGNTLGQLQLQLVLVGLGVVCAACLVNRCSAHSALIALTVGCAPGLTAHLLKGALERPSSTWDFAPHNSFPSGTVAAFAGISAALTFVARPAWQRALACAAWAGTGVVALIVIRAHWHRPSDVVGALLLAVGAWAVASGTAGRRSVEDARPAPLRAHQNDTAALTSRR